MPDERPLHERLLDIAVFVPIGIAASVAEELPALAEKGRKRLDGQLQVARMVGKLAVAEAQRRAGMQRAPRGTSTGEPPQAADGPSTSTASPASSAVPSPPPSTASRPSRTARPGKRAEPAASPSLLRPAEPAGSDTLPPAEAPSGSLAGAVAARATDQADPPAPEATDLPIPGYDTLAASQVVQRLASLRPDELDAVRRYEVATRGRRTILHRIGQLTSAGGRASA